MDAVDVNARTIITRWIVDQGHAPTADEVAQALEIPTPEVEQCFERLAAAHGLLLHPGSHRIWVAHPFSLAPTNFTVRAGNHKWWGSCTWCSLGIAAMLKRDTTIHTTLGAEETPVSIQVREDTVAPSDLLVHIAVPAAKWWDNVLYACGTMLPFEGISDIEAWCERHRIERGEVVTLDKLWRLSQVWYGELLDGPWRRKTLDESREIFASLGLTGEFWDPGAGWS